MYDTDPPSLKVKVFPLGNVIVITGQTRISKSSCDGFGVTIPVVESIGTAIRGSSLSTAYHATLTDESGIVGSL